MATIVLPKFVINDLSDVQLRNPETVKKKLSEALTAVGARDSEIERLGQGNQDLAQQLSNAKLNVQASANELAALRKELAVEINHGRELAERLNKIGANLPKISVQDLVSQVKTHIDLVNNEVISRKTDGMLVDNVEVEVRGGIDISSGLRISQLPAEALGAASASVLRFTLRPSSPLKIVEDDE